MDSNNFPYGSNVDPTSAPTGTYKYLRGGGVSSGAYYMSNHSRKVEAPNFLRGHIHRTSHGRISGLRLVRTAN